MPLKPLPPSLIRIPARARSRETASFLAQMDELSGRLWKDVAGTSKAELAWQPVRGRNTIGMLLAHLAIVEVFWLMIASETYSREALERVLRFGEDDDGMPLAANARPPRRLAGWTLARYRALNARARAYVRRAAGRFTDRALDGIVQRRRPNGQLRTLNRRWILYHVLEHFAGHYGQILLIRHEYRDRRSR